MKKEKKSKKKRFVVCNEREQVRTAVVIDLSLESTLFFLRSERLQKSREWRCHESEKDTSLFSNGSIMVKMLGKKKGGKEEKEGGKQQEVCAWRGWWAQGVGTLWWGRSVGGEGRVWMEKDEIVVM
jgi:hypothetical protein